MRESLIRQGTPNELSKGSQSVVAEERSESIAPVLQMVPGKLTGEWALGGEYDLDMVYARGSDKNGHSERPRVSFPPHMWAEVCSIIASGRTPYKTPVDMVRDGLYHRMHYWREKLPDLNWKPFDLEEALAATERRRARIVNLKAILEANGELLEAASQDQAWGILIENVDDVENLAAQISEQPYHNQLTAMAEKYRQVYNTRAK